MIFPRVMPIFENLVENSPKEWLIKNWDFCNYAYSLYTYLTDPDFVDSLENGVRSKLFDVLLVVDADSYAEDQHIEILVNLLTEDFVQTLPIATQHKLLEMFIEEIFQSFPDHLNLSSLVVFLTDLALMREDEYLISPKVLKHMSSIYQIYGNTMPEFFLDISVPYLHRLFSTFFQIWEKDHKPDQNPLPYWIVRSLLTKTEDIYQGEELLRRVIKHTPTIWGYEFSLLIQDIKWIPCFLLRAGIDWKREFLRQEALIDIYNDDDDDVDFDEDEDEDEDEDDYEDFEEEDAPTNQWWQKIQLHFQTQK